MNYPQVKPEPKEEKRPFMFRRKEIPVIIIIFLLAVVYNAWKLRSQWQWISPDFLNMFKIRTFYDIQDNLLLCLFVLGGAGFAYAILLTINKRASYLFLLFTSLLISITGWISTFIFFIEFARSR